MPTLPRKQEDLLNSYTHTETPASDSWTVSHDLDDSRPVVIVYDSTGEIVIPDTIIATDADTVTITFSEAVAGKAKVVTEGSATLYSADTITEANNDSGITIDGVLCKDNIVTASGGINLGDEDLSVYDEGTFTPTVTLVGGAGNVVPEYSTNIGRYTRVGNRVFVDILLTGDGGDEGAGTGTIHIALPFTVSASASTTRGSVAWAYDYNGAAIEYQLVSSLSGGYTTVVLSYWSSVSVTTAFTGAHQSHTSRQIKLSFSYEV